MNKKQLLDFFGVLKDDIEYQNSMKKLKKEWKEWNKKYQPRTSSSQATCITHNIPLLTLNKKHFERIPNLILT